MIEKLKSTRAGFTLVELIVVIAILGILAGISVPVYTGYIKKAGEAGDLQLLGALNTAYAAACAEMRQDPTKIVGTATLSKSAGGRTVTSISAAGVDAATNAKLNEAFMQYYGENAAKPFKVYTSLGYDKQNGVFVDGAKEYTFVTENGTVTVTAGQLSAYLTSSFNEIGAADLIGEVDKLTSKVAALFSTGVGATLASEANTEGTTLNRILTAAGLSWDSMSNTEKAHALILYAADASGSLDVDTWMTALKDGTVPAGDFTYDSQIVKTVAEYAMLTAWANDPDAKVTGDGTITAVNISQNDALKNIITDQTSDLTGSAYTEAIDAWFAEQNYPDGSTWAIRVNNSGTSILGINVAQPGESVSARDWLNNFEDSNGNTIANSQTMVTIQAAFSDFMNTSAYNDYVTNHAESDLRGFQSAMNMITNNTDNVNLSEILSSSTLSESDLVTLLQALGGNP